MTKVVAVISGKGGVGKTTVAVNIAAALVGFGRLPVVVDGDLHSPNVGMQLGSPSLPVTINQVLDGEHPVSSAMYLHPSGIRVVPASISFHDAKKARHEDVHIVVDSLRNGSDLTLLDCPAGLGKEVRSVIAASDAVIAVTTPDLVAVTDVIKSVQLAKDLHKDVLGVVVNQLTPESELSMTNIATLTGLPVLTGIPHDAAILESLKIRHPVVFSHPESISAIRFKELAALLVGDKYECGFH
ncbi:MAG: P-loop NTPase [Nanoarchaeota archaeon]